MRKAHFDEGGYVVTDSIIATPRRLYPLANTMVSIRRDPLWFGLGMIGLVAGCLAVYGDLLRLHEKLALFVIACICLSAGLSFSVLRLDAMGHRRAIIFGRRTRINRLYAAIRDVRRAELGITTIAPDESFR